MEDYSRYILLEKFLTQMLFNPIRLLLLRLVNYFNKMNYNLKILLMVILACITIYGIVTGKYLFLVFLFPFSFSLFKKNKEKD